MRSLVQIAIICLLSTTPLMAQAQTQFDVGRDRFLSGSTLVHNTDGVDDLFMAGETLRSERAISGSAHMAGRKVVVMEPIGGDIYAAAMDVSINAPVGGDVTAFGYDVAVGDVGGDLIASGKTLSVSGQVDGYAVLTGDQVSFNSVVKGDVSLTALQVNFTETAQIDGRLTVFEAQAGELEIPESVIPEDRIDRRPVSEASGVAEDVAVWDQRHPFMKFITRLVIVALITALIAVFIPRTAARFRERALRRPFSTFLLGFAALSAGIGSAIVLAITGVGFILVPIPLLIALIGAYAGYLLGVYLSGAGLLSLIGKAEQDRFANRALAAGIGAFGATLISRIPVIGWLGTLTITLVGVGALAVWVFRPKFFVSAQTRFCIAKKI